MSRDPLKGAVVGLVQVATNVGLLLILLPVFIAKLGMDTYGVYAVIMAVGNLGTFSNFGFATSLIKSLVEQRDREESNADIWVALLIVGGAATLVVLLLLVCENVILGWILPQHVAASSLPIHAFFVACVIAGGIQVVVLIPGAVLDACHKVYLSNGVQMVIGVVGKTAMLISLLVMPSLETLGWITLGSSFLGFFLMAGFARKTWGSLASPDLRLVFVRVARKHFRYGKTIYASSVISYFYEPATKMLISRFIGVPEVGYLDVALKVKTLSWSFLERLVYPTLPLLASKDSPSEARRVIEEVEQKLLLFVVPLIVGTLFLTKPVMEAWLGSDVPLVVSSTTLIVCSYLIASIFVPLYHYLSVKGHPEKTLVLQTVNVLVNLAAFALLVPLQGFQGAVIAFCLAVLASTALCGWYQWKILSSTPLRDGKAGAILVKLGLSLMAVNMILIPLDGTSTSWIIARLLIHGAATVLFYRWFRAFDRIDLERYIGGTPRIRSVLERVLLVE